jgi:hypothetical protein
LLSFLLSNVEAYSIDYLEKYLDINNIQYHINYFIIFVKKQIATQFTL